MDNTKDSPPSIVPILLPFSDPSSAAEWVAEFQAPSTEQELTLKLRSVEVAGSWHPSPQRLTASLSLPS